MHGSLVPMPSCQAALRLKNNNRECPNPPLTKKAHCCQRVPNTGCTGLYWTPPSMCTGLYWAHTGHCTAWPCTKLHCQFLYLEPLYCLHGLVLAHMAHGVLYCLYWNPLVGPWGEVVNQIRKVIEGMHWGMPHDEPSVTIGSHQGKVCQKAGILTESLTMFRMIVFYF